MKKKVKKQVFIQGHGLIETPETSLLTLHFLCPLELAAFKNKFQEFSYEFDGDVLDIDPAMCRELFANTKQNIQFFQHIIQQAKQKLLMRDARIKRFLTMPLRNHHLPIRLYHILHNANCTSMSHVAEKGIQELKNQRGMGKIQLNYLLKLFKDNNCGNLLL